VVLIDIRHGVQHMKSQSSHVGVSG
jgi:hypothetical protein